MLFLSVRVALYLPLQGVRIKYADSLKQYYSTTKRLAENIKTVLGLWGLIYGFGLYDLGPSLEPFSMDI
jgi:hypothetical protein